MASVINSSFYTKFYLSVVFSSNSSISFIFITQFTIAAICSKMDDFKTYYMALLYLMRTLRKFAGILTIGFNVFTL